MPSGDQVWDPNEIESGRLASVRRRCHTPSQSLTALVAIVSKTGWRSVCDPLITRKISLVAVCC